MAYTTITKPSIGDPVSKADFGDKAVDNFAYLYPLRDQSIWIPLNGATALVTGDKAYWRVPAKFNGGTLVGVAAACKVASTSGAVGLMVNNGATAMLSTGITLDQNETDTLTAATPAVISVPALATGNLIEISVTSAGTGVTYCGVELTVRPA